MMIIFKNKELKSGINSYDRKNIYKLKNMCKMIS